MKNKRIIITIGNPNGVGPEICFKAFKKFPDSIRKNFVLIGEEESIRYYFKNLELCEVIFISDPSVSYCFNPGEKSVSSGRLSYLFLKKAVELIKGGYGRALVTAPISKELIVKSGVKHFIDHTTYLSRKFGAKNVNMMFYSGDLKVVLITIHLPIKKIPSVLNKGLVKVAIQNAVDFGMRFFKKEYKIAVCGLNPHAGEGGLLGKEDNRIILPVVNFYKNAGLKVDGPLPSDTVFYKALNKQYDIVVAVYHDQGLAPFKMIHFNDGVNVTLGLPFIRTSPDHGCAFDIAGKGIADEGSMVSAIKLALRLSSF